MLFLPSDHTMYNVPADEPWDRSTATCGNSLSRKRPWSEPRAPLGTTSVATFTMGPNVLPWFVERAMWISLLPVAGKNSYATSTVPSGATMTLDPCTPSSVIPHTWSITVGVDQVLPPSAELTSSIAVRVSFGQAAPAPEKSKSV